MDVWRLSLANVPRSITQKGLALLTVIPQRSEGSCGHCVEQYHNDCAAQFCRYSLPSGRYTEVGKGRVVSSNRALWRWGSASTVSARCFCGAGSTASQTTGWIDEERQAPQQTAPSQRSKIAVATSAWLFSLALRSPTGDNSQSHLCGIPNGGGTHGQTAIRASTHKWTIYTSEWGWPQRWRSGVNCELSGRSTPRWLFRNSPLRISAAGSRAYGSFERFGSHLADSLEKLIQRLLSTIYCHNLGDTNLSHSATLQQL